MVVNVAVVSHRSTCRHQADVRCGHRTRLAGGLQGGVKAHPDATAKVNTDGVNGIVNAEFVQSAAPRVKRETANRTWAWHG